MLKEELIEYVKQTPHNTNEAILDQMLDKREETINAMAAVADDNLTKYKAGELTELYSEVDKIAPNVFVNQTHLKKVDLPKAEIIGHNAFMDLKELESVNLPECIEIGPQCFTNNSQLKRISLSKVRKIGDDAFIYNTVLEEVCLPELEELGTTAFKNSESLSKFDASKLKKIGYAALENTKIKEFIAPNLENDKLSSFGAYNSTLETLIIPKVKRLERARYWSALKRIEAPSLIELDSYHFQGSKIKEANFPNVTVIPNECFSGSLIESINLPKVISIHRYGLCNTQLREIILPELTIMAPESLSFNKKLEKIYCPKLKEIPQKSFMNLPNLQEADFSLVKIIGQEAFKDCKNLKKIYCSNVEIVTQYCFSNTAIEEIDLPKIKKMQSSQYGPTGFEFSGCTALKKVNLPALEEVYGNGGQFINCPIEKLNLPSLRIIEGSFIASMPELKTLILPKIESINAPNFLGVPKLEEVILPGDKICQLLISYKWVIDESPIMKFYVPANLLEQYKTTTNWSDIADRIFPIGG